MSGEWKQDKKADEQQEQTARSSSEQRRRRSLRVSACCVVCAVACACVLDLERVSYYTKKLYLCVVGCSLMRLKRAYAAAMREQRQVPALFLFLSVWVSLHVSLFLLLLSCPPSMFLSDACSVSVMRTSASPPALRLATFQKVALEEGLTSPSP